MRLSLALLAPLAITAADWPQFRGPNGSGVASESHNLPKLIAPDQNVLWKINTPSGHSSPIVVGDRIIITGVEGGERKQVQPGRVTDPGGKLVTLCLDRATGKLLWRAEVPRPRVEVYQPTNSPASPSPASDGQRVVVFFGDFGILSYDVKTGKEQWRLPLGPFNNPNGHGSSPILVDGLVVLLCDQDSDSYLLAVDLKSGKVRWKTPRPESTRSYSTPAVYRPAAGKGESELIVPGAFNLTAYGTSTGEKLWWIRGMSWQPKSSPVVDGEMIYAHWWESGGESESAAVTMSFAEALEKYDANKDGKIAKDEVDEKMRRGWDDLDLNHDGFLDARDWEFYVARRASRNALLAIRHGVRGDLTESKSIVWRIQKYLPNVPSPLLLNGVIYLIKDGGILTAVDAKTGGLLKQGRLTGALDTYYSSPVTDGARLYFMSQTGKFSIVKEGGTDWEVESVTDFAEDSFGTPAIASDTLYLRTRTHLYAFQSSHPSEPRP